MLILRTKFTSLIQEMFERMGPMLITLLHCAVVCFEYKLKEMFCLRSYSCEIFVSLMGSYARTFSISRSYQQDYFLFVV